MKAIVAVNNLGYIGRDNNLLWFSSEDLKHFKNLTMGAKLLVGYNTSLTLPPLYNREIFIDKREYNLKDIPQMDWCIGGKKTYEKFCHLFTELHISHINDNKIGDTMFPDLKNLNPNCKIYNYYFETNDKLRRHYS
jgi:dihydrofolate reductase